MALNKHVANNATKQYKPLLAFSNQVNGRQSRGGAMRERSRARYFSCANKLHYSRHALLQLSYSKEKKQLPVTY